MLAGNTALVSRLTVSRGADAIGIVGIGAAYFLLAKLGLGLASIHPSASPIWPASGFAVAAVLLWGYQVLPAVFVGALIANATTAGSIATSLAIAGGNTLEAFAAGYLLNHWSGGRATFDTPAGVAKFALVCFVPATLLSASIGAGSLSLAGYADWGNFPAIWLTWWLGDLAGALAVAPTLILYANGDGRPLRRQDTLEAAAVFFTAIVIGLLAFSPLIEQTPNRGPLAFLAIVPLMWAALRCGQRETAATALLLSAFAVWGTLASGGPFGRATLNESFLMLVMFMIGTAVPSLALSADVAVRRRAEAATRQAATQRDRALDELETTARTLNAILSNTDDPVYLFDADKRYRYVSPAGLRAIGQSETDAIGRTWREIGLPEHVMDPVERNLDRVLATGESVSAEAEHPPGRHWEYRLNPARRADGEINGVVATSRDITVHRRAEQALRESESRLKRAQEVGGISNWEWSPITGSLWWSEGTYRLVGRDPATFTPIEQDVLAVVHPDDRERLKSGFRDILAGARERFDSEFRTLWPDGSVRWLLGRADVERDADGRAAKLVGVCIDVTDRRRVEEALQEREKQLSILVNEVPAGIVQTDAAGRYMLVNDWFCGFVGRDRSDIIGRAFSDLIHPDDVPTSEHARARARETGEPYTLRRRYLRPDGSAAWAEVHLTLLGSGAEVTSVLAVVTDLTERMEAEARQNLLMNELNHRVKNTLASVQSLAVMSMRHSDSPKAFNQAFLSRVQALSTTHNLLTAEQWRGASLGEVIKGELLPYAIDDKARVDISGPPVALTPQQIINFGLFFHELATNAAKYGSLSAPAGTVAVSWRIEKAGNGAALMLQWRERGGPTVGEPTRRGFGSRLIEQTIREGLAGTIAVSYPADGFRCEVSVPL